VCYTSGITDETLQIAYATNDAYVRVTAVSIYSLAKHNPEKMRVYIIQYDLSERGKAVFLEVAAMFENVELEFITISRELREIADKCYENTKGRVPYITYLRFFPASLLPHLSKVLFIDGDTLVLGSILPFWNTDVANSYIAASPEAHVIRREPESYITSLGLDPQQTYINAGNFLMNLDLIRRDDIESRLVENAIDAKFSKRKFYDQDIINYTMQGHITVISDVFNFISRLMIDDVDRQKEAVIAHFAGEAKPWDNYYLVGGTKFFFDAYHTAISELNSKLQSDELRRYFEEYRPKWKKNHLKEVLVKQWIRKILMLVGKVNP
jgi:lipopolysaccharide biosynthesis glycosyltransferase